MSWHTCLIQACSCLLWAAEAGSLPAFASVLACLVCLGRGGLEVSRVSRVSEVLGPGEIMSLHKITS